MSLVLRHDPARFGVRLDGRGWIGAEALVEVVRGSHEDFTHDELVRVVAECPKQRFELSEDGTRVRAVQGHSVGVDLELAPAVPPDRLFHGTAERNLASIQADGLHAAGRDHVHLSADAQAARDVGMRYGTPIVLAVAAGRMVEAGHAFFQAKNGVWLTQEVPAAYLEVWAP